MTARISESTEIGPSFRLLLVVADVTEAVILWPLARSIVDEQQGELLIMQVLSVPEEDSLSESTAKARRSRDALKKFLTDACKECPQIKTSVRVGHDIWSDIWEMVHQELIDV